MSFRMSVLFCVLYYFSVAWIIGLNKNQIDSLVSKQKVYNDIFPIEAIIAYLTEVGYTGDVKRFQEKQFEDKPQPSCLPLKQKGTCVEFVVYNKTMPEFLILLADNEKLSDSWTEVALTTYEVKIFVRLFIEQDKKGEHDRILDKAELINLLKYLTFLEENRKQEIVDEFTDGEPINVLLYLAAILKHKRTNRQHLNKAMIDKCHSLYKKTKKHLDSKKQKAFFEDLFIIHYEYKYLLDIEHVRPAALELQELLVFYSEYHRIYDLAPVLTNVRQHMLEFSTLYDINHDGLIDIPLEEVARNRPPNYDIKTFLDEFFPDKARPICAATFLNMKLSLHPTNYMDEIVKHNLLDF